jgi:NADH-quinone oxidoreductase subunit E
MSEILTRYHGEKSELIPLLQEAQKVFGYLPPEVMSEIARFLRIPESMVFGACTFYAQFKLTPSGRQTVRVCQGTACHVRGSARILRETEKRLGIQAGETTDDLEYSLETIACFGSCALAPVMVVNKDVYGRMEATKVEQALEETKQVVSGHD